MQDASASVGMEMISGYVDRTMDTMQKNPQIQ